MARRCREKDLGMAARCEQMAERLRRSFVRVFWNEQAGCLYDCVRPEGPDAAIRPNQIFAVSLEETLLLPRAKQKQVVETVQKHLLTPMGLRSLSPEDPAYCGRYVGDPFRRDRAYHQGTVWAWLIGPFVEAYLRVHGFSAEAREQCRQWIRPLCDHLGQAGLGSVSEIFDGDPPHAPRGCIAQAWSVAELIRAHQLVSARAPVSAKTQPGRT
jgi:glycogen debranching enzyme